MTEIASHPDLLPLSNEQRAYIQLFLAQKDYRTLLASYTLMTECRSTGLRYGFDRYDAHGRDCSPEFIRKWHDWHQGRIADWLFAQWIGFLAIATGGAMYVTLKFLPAGNLCAMPELGGYPRHPPLLWRARWLPGPMTEYPPDQLL